MLRFFSQEAFRGLGRHGINTCSVFLCFREVRFRRPTVRNVTKNRLVGDPGLYNSPPPQMFCCHFSWRSIPPKTTKKTRKTMSSEVSRAQGVRTVGYSYIARLLRPIPITDPWDWHIYLHEWLIFMVKWR